MGWGTETRTTTIEYEFRVIAPENLMDATLGTAQRAARNCTMIAIGAGHAAGVAAVGGTGGAGAGAYPGAFWGAASGT